jgi:DNA-binding NarL/FixJ family response regulator
VAHTRILLADDHVMFVECLRKFLGSHFEIAGVIENGRDVVAAAERLHPDVVVIDISMPLLNGIEAARRISELRHAPKTVFLTMHEDPTFAAAALQARRR